MADIQHPTFGIHVSQGDYAPDAFYLGDDETLWDWIMEPAERGVRVPSYDGKDLPTGLLLFGIPDNYLYWHGHLFNPSKGLPDGLADVADARRTITVTEGSLLDDKAYIAVMAMEAVTPKEFYNADLPSNRILSVIG